MRQLTMDEKTLEMVAMTLRRSELFEGLGEEQLVRGAQSASLLHFTEGEVLMEEGGEADCFYIVLTGEATVRVTHPRRGEAIDVGRLTAGDVIGEMGPLLDAPRSATVVAREAILALQFRRDVLPGLFENLPQFALSMCRMLATRLERASRKIPLPEHGDDAGMPDRSTLDLLPTDFCHRNRVVPLSVEDGVLTVGFMADPPPAVVASIGDQIPGVEVRAVRVDPGFWDRAMEGRELASGEAMAAAPAASPASAPAPATPSSPGLDRILRRMVAEGASDLFLGGGVRPYWRVDGDVTQLSDIAPFGPEQVLEMLEPVLDERNLVQFRDEKDTDCAYSIPGIARFRVNLFRDTRGVGAVLRVIPNKILPLEQLGMPQAVESMCDHPKGLVLVTGPTGSGKSTTLAAMIDHINSTRRSHIITMEDPVEFVHECKRSLVNQREVGSHTESFSRALRAALREDPDIVLVGELRDLETISLALETALTGHLVFGTLHTSTAIGTIDRIVDIFPAEDQNRVRAALADALKGVVAQTLCKRIGGGRVAGCEILVVNSAVSNLIREGKPHQIVNVMQTGKAEGNQLLNEHLAELVKAKVVEAQEALSRTPEPRDLAKTLGL